jgi:hypothetical protein
MSEDQHQGGSEIESLLGERLRLQEWLDRLETATTAPQRVKDRVRADYEGRLTEVVTHLRGYTAALTSSLSEVRHRLGELEALKTEVEEELSEAALRHTVGEFGEQQWQEIDADCRGKLDGLGSELSDLTQEIERLEDVLRQIAPREPLRAPSGRRVVEDLHVQVIEPQTVMLEPKAPEGQAEPVAVQAMDQGRELAETQEGARGKPAEAPRFTPRGGQEQRPPKDRVKTLRFPQRAPDAPGGVDEMTFLKSVALESPESEDPQAKQRAAGSAKTLKCTECGAMNRPTEWYCERCGAELAAL